MEYKTTIGLEIHAELKTKTKMFCACLNQSDLDVKPNSNVCPICMGHPGTLPTINKKAVKNVLLVGASLEGNIADFTEFDRKNYFYPDIPKGYQISQYKYPLVTGGSLNGIEITRIHLEEDTATNIHKEDHSLVDFNRAGVPLMELVTEPVIHSAKAASDFAKELQLLLRTLGVADAEMSKGEMRVEANISVSPSSAKATKGKQSLGIKVEVKNLNSFKAVEKAIEFEVARHIEMLEKGEKIIQETRGWDENKQITFSQRQKEDSHDYRYFPDPDLPKLKLSLIPEFSKEALKSELPELPWEKRKRYSEKFGFNNEDAEFLVSNQLTKEFSASDYFDKVAENLKGNELTSALNYIKSDLVNLVNNSNSKIIPAESFAKLIKMVSAGTINSRVAKDLLKEIYENGGDPEKIAEEKGLLQKNDSGELEEMLKKIISENPSVVADYKAGKESALMFFVGQVMKMSKGSANPVLTREIAEKLLSM